MKTSKQALTFNFNAPAEDVGGLKFPPSRNRAVLFETQVLGDKS